MQINPPSRNLYSAGNGTAVTGTTSETALATITIPGGAMGANGVLRITALWTFTGSTNSKTFRVRMGGIGGTAFLNSATTTATNVILSSHTIVYNANSQSAQKSYVANSASNGPFGFTTSAANTGAIDTSADWSLVISGQLANTGETITLEHYIVEVLYAS